MRIELTHTETTTQRLTAWLYPPYVSSARPESNRRVRAPKARALPLRYSLMVGEARIELAKAAPRTRCPTTRRLSDSAPTWCCPTFSGSSDRRYHWTSSRRRSHIVCRAGFEPSLSQIENLTTPPRRIRHAASCAGVEPALTDRESIVLASRRTGHGAGYESRTRLNRFTNAVPSHEGQTSELLQRKESNPRSIGKQPIAQPSGATGMKARASLILREARASS